MSRAFRPSFQFSACPTHPFEVKRRVSERVQPGCPILGVLHQTKPNLLSKVLIALPLAERAAGADTRGTREPPSAVVTEGADFPVSTFETNCSDTNENSTRLPLWTCERNRIHPFAVGFVGSSVHANSAPRIDVPVTHIVPSELSVCSTKSIFGRFAGGLSPGLESGRDS